jgi:hypothetical protein
MANPFIRRKRDGMNHEQYRGGRTIVLPMNKIMMRKGLLLFIVLYLLIPFRSYAMGYDGRFGWPKQEAPKKLLLCKAGPSLPESMMVESLSGLAAQAVNEHQYDTMVWIDVDNDSYRYVYEKSVQALQIKDIKRVSEWQLLKILMKRHIVKGYVLYKADNRRENPYGSYAETDYSANVATIYASLLKGVLIDESLVSKARQMGLKELKDARSEDTYRCFENNKAHLNNICAMSIPPSVSNLRDYAIAHKIMLFADDKGLANKVLEWVKPLSPVLGWVCGDEYEYTSIISSWGDYNTATNWCMNLPLISSVGDKVVLRREQDLHLEDIDFSSKSSYHSYVMSDGDNIQWSMGGYIDSDVYMANPNCSRLGISWSFCPTEMSIISPFMWNKAVERQYSCNTLIEYGGGYQYPDVFGSKRKDRLALLREHARRLSYHLDKLNIKVLGFICKDVASKEAQEAFQIYAEEIPNLAGIIAVQYFPYELGGKIYWKTNKKGVDIPVVTARYSLWNEVNKDRPRAGVPEYVASLINRDETAAGEKGESTLSWTIVHAWSNFSETSPQTSKPAVGVSPILRTDELLLPSIKDISLVELLWRMRMKYRPAQTQELLHQ